jgi:hypothetical protein
MVPSWVSPAGCPRFRCLVPGSWVSLLSSGSPFSIFQFPFSLQSGQRSRTVPFLSLSTVAILFTKRYHFLRRCRRVPGAGCPRFRCLVPGSWVSLLSSGSPFSIFQFPFSLHSDRGSEERSRDRRGGLIIGCDFHTRYQQLAMANDEKLRASW